MSFDLFLIAYPDNKFTKLCGLLEIKYTGLLINSSQTWDICSHQESVARRYSANDPLSSLTRNFRGVDAMFFRLASNSSFQISFNRSTSSTCRSEERRVGKECRS